MPGINRGIRQYTAAEKRAYYAKKGKKQVKVAPGISMAGSGAYKQRVQKYQSVPRSVGGQGKYYFRDNYGKDLGSQIAGNLGGLIGEGIQSLGRAIGFGDYKVEHNVLMNELQGGPPVMQTTSKRGQVIRHREYLQNIVTASDGSFKLQSFALNPGLVQTFPWLSQVAAGFEQYKINGMIWEFKSTSADSLSSTTTSLGSVIMATEYDSSRAVFANQQQMANHEFAMSCRQSASMLHAVECKKSLTPVSELWVRTGAVPSGDDERLYDWGLFQIASVGGPSVANTVGELWVTYEVEFYKPQLIGGLGLELLSDHYSTTSTISTSHYFGLQSGSDPKAVTGSNLGTTISGPTIIFPVGLSEGNFMVQYAVVGNSTANTKPTLTFANCAAQNLFANDTSGSSDNSGSTSVTLLVNLVVKVTGQGATITFSAGTLPAAATAMDLWVNQLNANIVT
ncbi:capsid protein [Crucivirus-94]|nr:capsid protein [Crucivirus-94]